MIPSTKPDDIRRSLDDLQRATREVGEALARARGRDPQSFSYGLPSWYSMLLPVLAALFARDEAVWNKIAAHHGMTLDEWRDSLLDLFEAMPLPFRCSGCGVTDQTVWNKAACSTGGADVTERRSRWSVAIGSPLDG